MTEVMNEMDIAFPNLGIYLSNVPKVITLGNVTIALYGVIIAAAMLAGLYMAASVAARTKNDPNVIWDSAVWIIIFAIVGARIYYVIFFWDSYKDNLLQILNLRAGGLAIYGGIIACVIVIGIYCHIKKVHTLRFLDTAAYGLVLGQIIGRWGNFFNREVFGGYTDGLLAMRLPLSMVRERDITAELAAHITSNYVQVHPTFLYESLWNVGVLIVMLLWLRRKRFDGEITCIYFIGYGIGRAIIESIRTDQLYIGNTTIPVSIVVSLIMIGVSVIVEIYFRSGIRKGTIKADPWGWNSHVDEEPMPQVGETPTQETAEEPDQNP